MATVALSMADAAPLRDAGCSYTNGGSTMYIGGGLLVLIVLLLLLIF